MLSSIVGRYQSRRKRINGASFRWGTPLFAACLLLGLAGVADAETLAAVKARGTVVCGTAATSPGFSAAPAAGSWAGMGADYCRGLAAAIFNDPEKVQFAVLQPGEREAALASGKVDALADLLPWTLAADTDGRLKFVGTMLYDGQGFMVGKASGLKSARDLAGKPVCVEGFLCARDVAARQQHSSRTAQLSRASAVISPASARGCSSNESAGARAGAAWASDVNAQTSSDSSARAGRSAC